jgi:hypothetical protein
MVQDFQSASAGSESPSKTDENGELVRAAKKVGRDRLMDTTNVEACGARWPPPATVPLVGNACAAVRALVLLRFASAFLDSCFTTRYRTNLMADAAPYTGANRTAHLVTVGPRCSYCYDYPTEDG